MKNLIKKIFATIVFASPFLVFSIRVLLETLSQKNNLITVSSIMGLVFFIFACVFIYTIWKRKNIIPDTLIKKLITFLFKIICYLMWFIAISALFLDCAVDYRCEACDSKHIKPIISENGVILDLNKGQEIAKYDKDGWQSCGCRKLIAFDENPEYALNQIKDMNNYWQEYDNCHEFLSNYKVYAEEVNFDSNGSCYTHIQKKIESEYEEEEIVIIYDKQTNKLFYHYYSP